MKKVTILCCLLITFINIVSAQNTAKELMKSAYATTTSGDIEALADLIIKDESRSLEDAKGMAELIIHFESNNYGDFYKKNKDVISALKVGTLNKYLFSAFMFENIPSFYNCFKNGEYIEEESLFGIKNVTSDGTVIGKYYKVKKVAGSWKFWPEKLDKKAPVIDVNTVFKTYMRIVESNESIENKQKALDALIVKYKYPMQTE